MSGKVAGGQKIHFKNLIQFLADKRPSQRCSVCGQEDKGWKFHTQPIVSAEQEGNPEMTVFRAPVAGYPTDGWFVEMVCIECPNCGFMSFIGAKAVEDYMSSTEQGIYE